jgi:hypothetical protein
MAINLDFFTASITQDENNPFWTCSLDIVLSQDTLNLKPNDRINLNIYGEIFSFYVDQITINKTSPVEVSFTVSGLGVSCAYDIPRSSALTKIWEEDVTAFDAAQWLLDGKIQVWELENWIIPGYRLSMDKGSRVSTVIQIVQAAGGVLESYPNGDFYVRKNFPISPLKYEFFTPDQIFDEVVDIYNTQYNYQNARYVDWVRIMDIDVSSIADEAETIFDKDSQLAATVKVYPIPWRPVHLEHTGPADLQLTLIGEVVRSEPDPTDWQVQESGELEELVEIVEGKGSTKYPILSIESVRWYALDLLSLYFDPYTKNVYTTHPTEKYSLVYIKYTTKSLNYRTVSAIEQTVQYLVIDDDESPQIVGG